MLNEALLRKIRTKIKLIKENKNILLLNAVILIIYTLSSLKGFKDMGEDIGMIDLMFLFYRSLFLIWHVTSVNFIDRQCYKDNECV